MKKKLKQGTQMHTTFKSSIRSTLFQLFLFFTPDGKLLNRSIGAKNAEEFLALAANTLDPKNNYYNILNNYKEGKRDLFEMNYLARTGITLGDTIQSNTIAEEYLHRLKKDQWLTKDNIEFMRDFTKTPKDKGFQLFYKYADTIDKIMQDDTYAESLIQLIISKEVITPKVERSVKTASIPNWQQLSASIQKNLIAIMPRGVGLLVQKRVGQVGRETGLTIRSTWCCIWINSEQRQIAAVAMTSLSLNNYAWKYFNTVKTEVSY